MLGTLSVNRKAALLSVIMLVVGLLIWEVSIPAQKAAGDLTEYERLTGGGVPKAGGIEPLRDASSRKHAGYRPISHIPKPPVHGSTVS